MGLQTKVKTPAELENLFNSDRRRGVPPELCALLCLLKALKIPRAHFGVFKAREKFVWSDPDEQPNAPIRIYDIGASFRSHFLGGEDGDGKIEELTDENVLVFVHQLQRAASTADILRYLNLHNRPTGMSLSTMCSMLERQPAGEVGHLLTEQESYNLCFPVDVSGSVRVAGFACTELGWRLLSRATSPELESFRDWRPGTLVFTEAPLCDRIRRMSKAELKRERRRLR